MLTLSISFVSCKEGILLPNLRPLVLRLLVHFQERRWKSKARDSARIHMVYAGTGHWKVTGQIFFKKIHVENPMQESGSYRGGTVAAEGDLPL